ncbi:MAG: hypothetical protein WDA09_08095 [Bacteriovoracaceae bacterium]
MSKVIKARVISGRYKNEIVRITNVSTDELGRKKAACILNSGGRANIPVEELEIIHDVPVEENKTPRAKTASMPFISGSSSSRTLTHTKNMAKNKIEVKPPAPSRKQQLSQCAVCGAEYDVEERRGRPGKITVCEDCAELDE